MSGCAAGGELDTHMIDKAAVIGSLLVIAVAVLVGGVLLWDNWRK